MDRAAIAGTRSRAVIAYREGHSAPQPVTIEGGGHIFMGHDEIREAIRAFVQAST